MSRRRTAIAVSFQVETRPVQLLPEKAGMWLRIRLEDGGAAELARAPEIPPAGDVVVVLADPQTRMRSSRESNSYVNMP